MTLIVEDGSNVAGANSYLDLTDIRAYCLNRGVTLPVDATLEPMVFKAMDYIESKRNQYQGTKTDKTQSLQFPRCLPYYNGGSDYPFQADPVASIYGIIIDGFQIASDEIPQVLKDLLCQCVLAINSGVDFANLNQKQKFSIMEKVGPIQTAYSEKVGTSSTISIRSIDDMFNILFGTDNTFRTVKV